MATQGPKITKFLFLDRITLRGVPRVKYTLRLFVEDEERDLRREDNMTWTPAQRPDVTPTSQLLLEVQMKSGHLLRAKKEQTSERIDLQNLFNHYWTSTADELTVQKVVVVGGYRCSFELQFTANTAADYLRSSLHKLEGLLKDYSPLMNESTERALEKAVQYGAAFSELNGIAKAAFSVAKVTFGLLKEQNKYDQMPSCLFDRLQRILFFADKVIDEIVGEETEILEKTIPRMFEVMQTVASFSCNYVRHGRFERTVGGLVHPEKIEEMDSELAKVIEDFDRAVNVETLRLIKETEQELLLGRLKYVEAGYDLARCCMEGTRRSILNRIMAWVADPQERNGAPQRNTYWFYGSPGIGKTWLAHSICANLHDRGQLAGAFFCRRDDPNLSDPSNILPTLIYKLAGIFPAFRVIVANRLRNDLNLTPKAMKHTLFLDFIRNLPRHPKNALVFVIDALDECGDDQSRSLLLKVLIDAADHASWLKIIITSRPEVDIQRFFDAPMWEDLGADQEAKVDLQTFARSQFDSMASKWHLPASWPEEPLFNRVVSQANGLFIFVKTFFLALEQCEDPKASLEAILKGSAGPGMEALYKLYSNILKSRLVHSNVAAFQRTIGVLLTTAPNRSLCEETIATLADVPPHLVKKWVDDLSSLLYRDEGANGEIHVRHLSISEFFISDHCDYRYRVTLQDAHAWLGVACLETMVEQLRFNICKLEDSRLANAQVKDLQTLIKQNISDTLQYSSFYWSNHLCFAPNNRDRRVLGSLKKFFEGVYPLFWIEVLSIMGMVPIGAPSLRRVISWVKGADSTPLENIQDICHFIIMFHIPVSISAPHTYISTRPFLPSQSPLLTVFSKSFTKDIKMQRGKMLSWPAPPLKLIGHTNAVTSMSYSPNGCHIVTGSCDGTIRIWDAGTGAVVGEPLEGHNSGVLSVACSPDGRHIISGSEDNTIRIWDTTTGAVVGEPLEGHTSGVSSVACSPDGRHIISGSDDKTIRIWDAKTGALVGEPLEGHNGGVWSVAYSPNGRHIISGSVDTTIRIWDAETGAVVGKPPEGHTDSVLSIAYSPDGQHIISGSGDKTIRIWDAWTGVAVGKPLNGHSDRVWSVVYSPDGRHIISGSSDKTIRIWGAATGTAVGEPLEGHTWGVTAVACSPDGRHIISGSGDGTIRTWDAETGAPVGESTEGHIEGVWSVSYSPVGPHIASGSGDGSIRIWDAETGTAVSRPLEGHTECVRSVAYSPDGRHIISGSVDTTIRIWDAETGAVVGNPLEGHTSSVVSVAYSPDGRYIISGSFDNTVRIWDAETCTPVGEPLDRHTNHVKAVAYSPDGQHLISGADSTIHIWDTGTAAAVGRPLNGHTGIVYSVAYSPDGQHIISGSEDKTIRIWNAKTSAAVGKPLMGHMKSVWSIAYSPDGRHIISGSADGTIRIWDAETGAALGKPLNVHPWGVWSVAPSPDGLHIVSGSRDIIHVWDFFPRVSTQNSSCNPMYPYLYAQPDRDGWIRDSEQSLLYWVPPGRRAYLHSPALLTIYLTSDTQSVSLDFEDFSFGTSWTQIYNGVQP